ncbi:TIGR02647 family protein [Neptunomonas antarctica]|uniref:TIGR02647 family protein n=1 Tax=Neptunomonas antarctica TaxID=619304 RepID=A0A1N7K7W4_9GAMM|nr:TIGR02647 family protein [Neptunomonas antarctica]SIS57692.1 TIGR02647 family protein [Neptunomonas antarctica]
MPYDAELVAELNLLNHFNVGTTQEGIKVHHSAAPHMIEAAKRLFDKDLITQEDGGYLTDLGHDAAEHSQSLILILTTPVQLDTTS